MCTYRPAFTDINYRKGTKSLLLALCFLINFEGIWCQASKKVIYISDRENLTYDSLICNSCDSLQVKQELNSYCEKWWGKGYFTAAVDAMHCDSSQCHVSFYKGPFCSVAYLNWDSISQKKLSYWTAVSNAEFGRYKQVGEWLQFFNKITKDCTQNGYPFASFHIQKLSVNNDSLIANVSFSPGPQITYRRIDQRQKQYFSESFLQRYLNMAPGKLYNHENVLQAESKINKLGYMTSTYSPRVLFIGNESMLWLYLDKKNSNRFDFLLGLIPNTGSSARKYRLSGEANFEIYNALKMGEQFKFRYENLVENSPRLQIQFDFPFIYTFPFGIASEFKLQRFGERFIELQSKSWLNYPLSASQRIGISYEYNSLSMLNPDTQTVISSGRLPRELDVQINSWGLSYVLDLLDHRIVPTKGWYARIECQLGTKEFRPNNTLLAYSNDNYPLQQQYDSLNKNNEQLKTDLWVQYFFRFKKRHVIRLADQFQVLYSKTFIASNEFYRFGGYKTIRGFDENFFISPFWNGVTLEYRFLLDASSFIHIYTDWAKIRQLENDVFAWNDYQSIGAGLQFQTKIGLFGLQYAVGRKTDTSFDLSTGKIHFGYTSLF